VFILSQLETVVWINGGGRMNCGKKTKAHKGADHSQQKNRLFHFFVFCRCLLVNKEKKFESLHSGVASKNDLRSKN
jgi:hypothetical protein